MPDCFLAGRSALVTGGLTGQGLAIAGALAEAGANVAVGSYVGGSARLNDSAAYLERPEVERVRKGLASRGTKIHAGHLDARNQSALDAFVRAAESACGPFGILVNAAGTTAEHLVSGPPCP